MAISSIIGALGVVASDLASIIDYHLLIPSTRLFLLVDKFDQADLRQIFTASGDD